MPSSTNPGPPTRRKNSVRWPRTGSLPKPAARSWTPEDEHLLVKLYREGISFAELASVLGRTEGAILRRLILLRAAVLPDTAPAEAPGEAPVSE